MRIVLIVIGVILLALGVWVTVGAPAFSDTDTLVKVGPAELNASHDEPVPEWLGIAGIVVGAALLLGGAAARRKS